VSRQTEWSGTDMAGPHHLRSADGGREAALRADSEPTRPLVRLQLAPGRGTGMAYPGSVAAAMGQDSTSLYTDDLDMDDAEE
jgi:hypothetical protein